MNYYGSIFRHQKRHGTQTFKASASRQHFNLNDFGTAAQACDGLRKSSRALPSDRGSSLYAFEVFGRVLHCLIITVRRLRPLSHPTMSGHDVALFGVLIWCLLVPPYVAVDKFDAQAPLAKWYETADFDSLSDCQRYRADTIKRYQQQLSADPGSRPYVQVYKESQCVSSDDPRRARN